MERERPDEAGTVVVREMRIEDYDSVLELWSATDGIGLSDADSKVNIAAFLQRNPGLSFVVLWEGQIVGAALCGQDGRRGYLHHLTVQKSYRKRGLGKALIEACFNGLREINIAKCHIFVFKDNIVGIEFWNRSGWQTRGDLQVMSKLTRHI